MNETDNEESEATPLPYGSAQFPTHDTGNIPGPGGVVGSGGRIEANTALLRVSRANTETDTSAEFNNSGLMGLGSSSGEFPLGGELEDEDEQSTAAASARIAQEYRRQVRIKRLAEEIQQAERDKKKDEKRRKEGGTEIRPGESNRKEETAKLNVADNGEVAPPENDPEISRKRAEALSQFKRGRSSTGKWVVLGALAMLLVFVSVGGTLLYNNISNRNKELTADLERRKLEMEKITKLAAAVDPKYALLESKVEKERQAREAAQLAAEEEKRVREEAFKKQEELARIAKEERELMLAEVKRTQEAARKFEEETRKRDEELRKRAEDASRIAREKMRLEQEQKKAETEAAAVPEPEIKSVAATPQGEVRTSPPQPAGIAGKSDLPTGAVRLFCKASDPYGGRLTFHWKQTRGTQVEIADPNFSVQKDGKWYSQTYFVARSPGSYEFEVSVKNEDGVESTRKYPIEVLPVTTMK